MLDSIIAVIESGYKTVKSWIINLCDLISNAFKAALKTRIGFKVAAYVTVFVTVGAAYVAYILVLLAIGAASLIVPWYVFAYIVAAFLAEMALWGVIFAVAHEVIEIVIDWLASVSRSTVTA